MNGIQQQLPDISSDTQAIMSMYLDSSMEKRMIVSRSRARGSGINFLSMEEWKYKFIYI